MIRLLKVFAESGKINLQRYQVLDKLSLKIDQSLDELEELDAINLIKAFEFIENDVYGSQRLFNKVN